MNFPFYDIRHNADNKKNMCRKRIHILTAVLTACLMVPAFGEDYQYQYFTQDKDKYVPFSDYIPRVRLHYETVPHYVEDYYRLYGMKEYYNDNSLHMNIARLKTALTRRFRHPSEALVKVDSAEEYAKYRKLMFMHINLLIMRNHLKLAARYDMQKIKFYHVPFSQEINDSFITAEKYYREAIPYWKKAKKLAEQASTIKLTTDLSAMESERYSIIHGELDYDKIIGNHLKRLAEKKKQLGHPKNS